MFDNVLDADRAAATTGAWNPASDQPAATAGIPLERLEAQICELAGHLAAATCRFLVLLGDFDAQQGWASWEMTSCAAWLSWKCQMSSGTAREHVRVARALRELPVTRGEFAVGRLSYAKVRALTRIATPATEASLAELAAPMTANQLERFARAHRQVSSVDDTTARIRRRLAFRIDDDGTLSGTFHLPPLAGAVLLKALRSAVALDHPAPAFDEHHPADPEHSDPADPEHSDPADPEHSDRGSGSPGRFRGNAREHPAAGANIYQPGRRAPDHRRGLPGRPSRIRRRSGALPGHPPRRHRCPTSRPLHRPASKPPGRPGRRPALHDDKRFRGNARLLQSTPAAAPAAAAAGTARARRPRGSCALPRRGRPGSLPQHGADDRLLCDCELDAARQRGEAPGPRPATAPSERRVASRRPGPGQMPVPVPGL